MDNCMQMHVLQLYLAGEAHAKEMLSKLLQSSPAAPHREASHLLCLGTAPLHGCRAWSLPSVTPAMTPTSQHAWDSYPGSGAWRNPWQ